MAKGMGMMTGPKTYVAPEGGARDTKYILKKLGHYLLKYRWPLLAALLLTFLSNMLALVCRAARSTRLSGRTRCSLSACSTMRF